MHIRIYSQTGKNYGFTASRTTPLLFQVEQDLSERIDRADEQTVLIETITKQLLLFETQAREESTFWDKN